VITIRREFKNADCGSDSKMAVGDGDGNKSSGMVTVAGWDGRLYPSSAKSVRSMCGVKGFACEGLKYLIFVHNALSYLS